MGPRRLGSRAWAAESASCALARRLVRCERTRSVRQRDNVAVAGAARSWSRRLAAPIALLLLGYAVSRVVVSRLPSIDVHDGGSFFLATVGVSIVVGSIAMTWVHVSDGLAAWATLAISPLIALGSGLPHVWAVRSDAVPSPGEYILLAALGLFFSWLIATTMLLPLYCLVFGTYRALAGRGGWGEPILAGAVLCGWTCILAIAAAAQTQPGGVIAVIGGAQDGGAGAVIAGLSGVSTAALVIAWFRLPLSSRQAVRGTPMEFYLPR